MHKKNINKKILNNLQSALNDTFDEFKTRELKYLEYLAKNPKLKDEYIENDNYRYLELKECEEMDYEHYTNIQLRFVELAGNFGLTDFINGWGSVGFQVKNYEYKKVWVDEELEMRGIPPFELLPINEQTRIKKLLLEYLETDYLVKYDVYPSSKGTKIIIRVLEDIYQNVTKIIRNKEKDK